MRYLTAVLIASLLAMGVVQATWYWSPPSHVQPSSEVGVYTGASNARCIAGTGSNIYAVYSRDVTISSTIYKKTYFRRSTNLGATWSDPYPLVFDEDGDYDALSPTIGLWTGESLFAAWVDGRRDEVNGKPIDIKSRVSINHGVDWQNEIKVNPDNWHDTCLSPSLICDNYTGQTGHVVWATTDFDGTNRHYHICHNPGFWDPQDGWCYHDDGPVKLHNEDGLLVEYPSIWSQWLELHATWMRYGDQIRCQHGEWPRDWCARDTEIEYGNSCAHPTIAFDSIYEAIAYEKVVSGASTVRFASREWGPSGPPETWDYFDFPDRPGWAVNVKRPHLFGAFCYTNRRTYLGATGLTSGGIPKGFVMWSSDGGDDWHKIRNGNSEVIGNRTDSVSLWAKAYGLSSYLRNRVWAIASGYIATDPISKLIIARVISEYPEEVGPPAGLGPFGGNSARRVVRQPGTNYLHRAHPIDNYISYERSTDNGETWSFQDAPDFGTNPALALYDGAPVVSTVWTEEYSTNYAGVGYKRWQLGEEGGGGTQSTSIFDPGIRPQLFSPSA